MTEKQVPVQLSSEATFNTAKGFFLEQLEAHFGLCLENCEDEKVLEGIDTFKEQIEAWQEGGVREGSLNGERAFKVCDDERAFKVCDDERAFETS